ncbi:hypothetical protein AB6A40_002621 [Gnathostoma spinigerum]|uniref:ATP synthase-coupling factor 6, mitochondrial n=1 Tax=Gnathostoma spinigerum TaxID=75299 RepID=A0ABD6E9D1_9BILA
MIACSLSHCHICCLFAFHRLSSVGSELFDRRLMLRSPVFHSFRRFSTSQILRSEDLIQKLFVKKIKEYAQKEAAAAGKLVDATPDVEKSLSDELNRLANKFHLINSEAVRELPTDFETPSVVSSVEAALEKKTLKELKSEMETKISDYMAERKERKMQEEARRLALSQTRTGRKGIHGVPAGQVQPA